MAASSPPDKAARSSAEEQPVDDGTVPHDPTVNEEEPGINLFVLKQFEPALDVQMMLRVRGVPHRVVNVGHSWELSTGPLPQVLHGSELTGKARIEAKLEHALRSKGKALDAIIMQPLNRHLTAAQKGTCMAFSALLDGVLEDVMLFCKYAMDEVYEAHTRPALLAQGMWPLNHYHAWSRRREVLAHLRRAGMTDMHWAEYRAKEAYDALARLFALNHQEVMATHGKRCSAYAFGRQPSTLDAKLFGHLVAVHDTPAWGWATKHDALKRLYYGVAERYFMKRVDLAGFTQQPVDGAAGYAVQGKNYFTQLVPPPGALRTPTLPPSQSSTMKRKTSKALGNAMAQEDREGADAAEDTPAASWWWTPHGTWGTAALGGVAVIGVMALGTVVLSAVPSFVQVRRSSGSKGSKVAGATPAVTRPATATPVMMPSSLRPPSGTW